MYILKIVVVIYILSYGILIFARYLKFCINIDWAILEINDMIKTILEAINAFLINL